MAADDKFKELAPLIVERFADEFKAEGIKYLDCYAVVGNLGHESAGFKFLQEIKPLIPGSRGGYGWAQWTGPRRVQFERYCRDNKLPPDSFEANFRFLVWELRNTETKGIPALKAAPTLFTKVKAFELAFERASIHHKGYESRNRWAMLALRTHEASRVIDNGKVLPAPVDPTQDVAPEQLVITMPPARMTHGKWAEDMLTVEEIKIIQRRLRELGYVTVGKVDGSWGPNVRNSIFALQADRRIPADGHYGPQTKRELEQPGTKPLALARVSVTEDDLAAQGSRTVTSARKVNWSGAMLGVGAALTMVYELLPEVIETLQPLKDQYPNLPGYVWPVAAVLLGFYIRKNGSIIKHARLEDERLGKHVGRPDPAPSPPVTEDGP